MDETEAVAALSHHEIFRLVEPFTRAGFQVDLAASDRAARRLGFRPQALSFTAPPGTVCSATLSLSIPVEGEFVLTRAARLDDGLQARLECEAGTPAEVLAMLAEVPPETQFRFGSGWRAAHSHRVEARSGRPATVRLVSIEARMGAVVLRASVPALPGYPADLVLETPQDFIDPPDDLLAVLGRRWARLWRVGAHWHSSLRLRGADPARSLAVATEMERAAAHLAETLAESPARFGERLARTRWAVAGRRALPALSLLGLVAAALAVPQFDLAHNSVLRMLVFNAPPLLLALGVCLQELPRFEWPRPPQALKAGSWQRDT